ncbi:aspartic peptidase domain-containing protein [Mycena galopus ATCC 62051]|nr:aspartic peptidase domain-containing protein [Mycena galopus ATCC 62051]
MISLPLGLAALLLLPAIYAVDPIHIPLKRKVGRPATYQDHLAAAEFMRARYGFGGAATKTTPTPAKRMQRRGSAESLNFINQGGDASYFGTVDIGTPLVPFFWTTPGFLVPSVVPGVARRLDSVHLPLDFTGNPLAFALAFLGGNSFPSVYGHTCTHSGHLPPDDGWFFGSNHGRPLAFVPGGAQAVLAGRLCPGFLGRCDTGSSDLWVADSNCANCDRTTPVFNSGASKTFEQVQTSPIPISYGSGNVAGILATESVSMGNFSITSQGFLSVETVSEDLLSGSVSGIMGLAFGAISSTGAIPFWNALITDNQLAAPEMAFWLTRFRGTNFKDEEPGGSFTLGGTNASLFQGDIEFLPMAGPSQPSFWLLGVSEINVQGQSLKLAATGNNALAAIDTGTTLIGGPSADVANLWAQIPGSALVGPSMPGFYEFPCSTTLNISMGFGGSVWPISPDDMNVSPGTSGNMCLGGIFDLSQGSSIEANEGNPSWVVGDTFLKNVYSVFRQDPLSIGFAELSAFAGSSGAPGAGSGNAGIATTPSAKATLAVLLLLGLGTALV